MNRWLAPVLGVLFLSACDVASVNQAASAIAQNQCSSSSECPGGDCEQGQCRSHSGTISTVLFEVTPADASANQFLSRVEGLPAEGGEHALELDVVSQVSGKVTVRDRKCTPTFDDHGIQLVTDANASSIPVTVTLTPTSTLLGLYSPRAVVQSQLVDEKYFGFSLNVPPGAYDIYIEPKHQPANDSCPIPPQLLLGQMLSGGTLSLDIKQPEPASFEFHVTWPLADGGLDGWVVDMLDPLSGRIISNRVTLALGAGGQTDYIATLYYFPVVGGTKEQLAEELVRLSPPDPPDPSSAGPVAPKVLLARSALGLFDPTHGVLTQFTALPSVVRVQGQVTALGSPQPVAATVTLVASKITGIDTGVLASFVRTVQVDETGDFELDLLPGTYRVSAVPRVELDVNPGSSIESTLAAVGEEWVVPSTPSKQAGKVITLPRALPIKGQAAAGATALATADVSAVVSPASVQRDVLHQVLGEVVMSSSAGAEKVFVPRASSANVDGAGEFALTADTGVFDVSVRPLPSTGFAWLVIPQVPVGIDVRTSAGANLLKQNAPLPVVYHGTVTVPGSPRPKLAGALIRAYVYMIGDTYTSDFSKADSVLQIAETRADDQGNYEVLIPAALNHWAP